MDERYLDWDEGEAVNRPQDNADDWEAYCLTEEQHKKMLEEASKRYREEMEAIKRRYENDIQSRSI